MSDHKYAMEKLRNSLGIFQTGEGNIFTKLYDAYIEFNPVQVSDFPRRLQERWREINRELMMDGVVKNSDGKNIVGAVENTLKNMSESNARNLMLKIENIYDEMVDIYGNE